MTDIYTQRDKAFSNVSAYVVIKNNERVATVAIKFPKDGAGRLWAYVHFIGVPMVRGHAGGYGYDKQTAAVLTALSKIKHPPLSDTLKDMDWALLDYEKERKGLTLFTAAVSHKSGKSWSDQLTDAGYTILQAV